MYKGKVDEEIEVNWQEVRRKASQGSRSVFLTL